MQAAIDINIPDLESRLIQAGFNWVPPLPGYPLVLQRDYHVSQVRGVLRARLHREGAFSFDRVSIVYNREPELVSLFVPSRSYFMEYLPPQHLHVLWMLGVPLDLAG